MALVVFRPHQAEVPQLNEQVLYGSFVLVLHVGLEHAVGFALVVDVHLHEAHRKPGANARVELGRLGIVAEHDLDGLPILFVQALLLFPAFRDQQVVANHVAGGQRGATGIQGLEDQLGTVFARKVGGNEQQMLHALPQARGVEAFLLHTAQEVAVVGDHPLRHALRQLGAIHQGKEGLAVGAGKDQLVLVSNP